jgi:hypothetical protein
MPDTPETTRVTLELDVAAGGIRGLVESSDGRPRAFEGWLELSALLDQARQTSSAATLDLPLDPNR